MNTLAANDLDGLVWPFQHDSDTELIHSAIAFARDAHDGQQRKYTHEPYIEHPVRIAHRIAALYPDIDTACAAVLHDVVEDTERTHQDIHAAFGAKVSALVYDLTNVATHEDGPRAVRKRIDRVHLSLAAPQAKLVKLADIHDNCSSIFEHDPDFGRMYAEEKRMMLGVLSLKAADRRRDQALAQAHKTLMTDAQTLIAGFQRAQGRARVVPKRGTAAKASARHALTHLPIGAINFLVQLRLSDVARD